MDVLFFQPAVFSKGKVSFNSISNGLVALGMYLKQNEHNSKICYFNGVRSLEESVKEKIRMYNPQYVGINLTWHMHCAPAIKIAKAVKKLNSNTKIIFGGSTASYFDREILEYAGIDDLVIIRGDTEEPLLEFIKTGKIPNSNTSFLDKRKFIRNSLIYTQAELPKVRLTYPIGELIDDWEKYLRRDAIRTSVPGLENKIGHNTSRGEFHLYVGKGCRNNCSYCGGGRETHKLISGRNRMQFREIDDVKTDIRRLVKDGVETLYIDFDPDPKRKFYLELFKKLKPQTARLMFSAWCGPLSSEMLDLINKKFSGVEIVVSPESGSERLRKELIRTGYGKPPFYSNEDLLKFFRELQKRRCKAICYFISGIPGEREEDRKETLELAQKLKEEFSDIFVKDYDVKIERNLCSPPLYIEPCSPLQRKSSIGFTDYLSSNVPYLNQESFIHSSEFRKRISRGKNV